MDRRIEHAAWSPQRLPIAARIGVATILVGAAVLLVIKLATGSGGRTLRMPLQQVSIETRRVMR